MCYVDSRDGTDVDDTEAMGWSAEIAALGRGEQPSLESEGYVRCHALEIVHKLSLEVPAPHTWTRAIVAWFKRKNPNLHPE